MAKSWVTNPQSCRQWLGFEATGTHYKDEANNVVTSFGFRLSNEVNEYWWDGGAWVINTTNWNTEAEVATNISSFPQQTQKIQIVINLVTTDRRYTPELEEIKVLYSSDIEFQEDIIFRSLLPLLKSEIKVIADYAIVLEDTTDTIDLANIYPLDSPYNIVDIDSVFDNTNDPDHWTDLYQSYNSTTKVITLNTTVTAGDTLWIQFLWTPLVAVTTSQEYDEIDAVPSLLISDLDLRGSKQITQYDWVADKEAGTAVVVLGPRQKNIELNIKMLTPDEKSQTRFADEIKRFTENNYEVTSVGLDEKYSLTEKTPYDARTYAGQKGLHTGNVVWKLHNVLFFEKTEIDANIVTRFVNTLEKI
jgi:hypothetical protein